MSYFNEAVARRGLGSEWEGTLRGFANLYGVEVALVKAVISAESAWNYQAVSFNDSSMGLMQINAAAWNLSPAAQLARDQGLNLKTGCAALGEQMRKRNGDLLLVMAAYNAGTNRSDADLRARYQGNVNGVKNYVDTVLAFLAWFRTHDVDPGAGGDSGGGDGSGDPGAGDPVPTDTTGGDGGNALEFAGLGTAGVVALGLIGYLLTRGR